MGVVLVVALLYGNTLYIEAFEANGIKLRQDAIEKNTLEENTVQVSKG